MEYRGLAERILDAGVLEVRDVDSGAKPFVYSTGNRGPGYVQVKGLVGRPALLRDLMKALAQKVLGEAKFDFINGNATGGMVPAWELRNQASVLLGREIPYVYLRGARKEGGHGELITGAQGNPKIHPDARALIVEELVNYAGTTCNAAKEFRRAGYQVSHAATILSYDHPEARLRLQDLGLTLLPLFTLPVLLNLAQSTGRLSRAQVESYREFLAAPLKWQLKRGLVVPETASKQAKQAGIALRPLTPEEAMKAGAPETKVKVGVRYLACD
jgi:orotate phosphoribosyltransferase